MDLHNCVVRLAGDLNMTVHKEGVTAAELVLLQREHGSDSVVHIVQTKTSGRAHVRETARLAGIYGAKAVAEAFPGANPRLPLTIKEAGLRAGDPPPRPVLEDDDDIDAMAAAGGEDEIDAGVLADLAKAGLDPKALA